MSGRGSHSQSNHHQPDWSWTHYVSEDDREFFILLPPASQDWNGMHVLPCPIYHKLESFRSFIQAHWGSPSGRWRQTIFVLRIFQMMLILLAQRPHLDHTSRDTGFCSFLGWGKNRSSRALSASGKQDWGKADFRQCRGPWPSGGGWCSGARSFIYKGN